MSRLAATVAGALLLLGLAADPAAAHTRASSATNFDSRITQAPALEGVTWRIYPGGEYLEVVNATGRVLVVHGYEGEPYLRIGPSGVERNRNSPATYVNSERYADVAVPPRADASALPDWELLGDEPRHAWHDHRTHWMSPRPPPSVRQAPDVSATVLEWTVPFEYAGEDQAVRGTLRWVPGPPWWRWLGVGLVLTAGALLGRRAAAVVVAAVALVNLAHLLDEVAALPLPALDVVFGILHNLLFVGVGLAGAVLTLRGRTRSLLPLGLGSGAVLFHQGLLQVSQLSASQLATVWPAALIRLLVALSLGQAVWVAVVIARGVRAPSPATSQDGTLVPAEPVLSAPDNL